MTRGRPAPGAGAPVRRGDRLELEIEGLGDGGDGIGKHGSYVLLVPGTLPGERVLAEVASAARKYGRAVPLRLLRAAPERTVPECEHFLDCGGCQLQHLDRDPQLRFQRERIERLLARALGAEAPPVAEPVAAPAPYGTRHKVAVHLLQERPDGPLVPSFHRARSVDLVPVRECPASEPRALRLAFAAVKALDSLRLPAWDPERSGVLRSVLVRRAAATGEAHCVVVAATRDDLAERLQALAPALHREGATALSYNANDGPAAMLLGPHTQVLSGPPRIRERIADVDLLVSPAAFFQTSPAGAAAAVRLVHDALRPAPGHAVADLFCGGGLFALPLARACREVLGVELSAGAVADAEASAQANGIANARFVRDDVLAHVRSLAAAGRRFDAVVLDPPRAGCGPELAAAVAALRPARAAYVSCEPRALAGDLRVFAAHGLRAVRVTPIEMFPQTAHVEAVAWLEAAG